MVALASPNVVFHAAPDPAVVRVEIIEVRKANSGDTIDVVSLMTPRVAMFIGTTVQLRVPATIAGTVITLPAGLTNDSGYLVVMGL